MLSMLSLCYAKHCRRALHGTRNMWTTSVCNDGGSQGCNVYRRLAFGTWLGVCVVLVFVQSSFIFFFSSLSHSHARGEHNNSCSCIIIITMNYEDTHDNRRTNTHTRAKREQKKKFIRVPHVLHENHIRTIQWFSLNFVVEFHKQSIRVCCCNFVNCRYGGVDGWLGWLAGTACVRVKWV